MRPVLRRLQWLSDDMVDQRGSSVNCHSQSAATSHTVLPLIIEELHVVSRPDSEFEDNVIAEDVVSRLELGVGRSVEHRRIFKVAVRNLLKALSIVSVACTLRDRPSRRYTAYGLSFGPTLVHS